jgi:transposase-like protein
MKRRRHTPEQIVRKLAVADKLLGEGKTIEEVCRELEVTESTFRASRHECGSI